MNITVKIGDIDTVKDLLTHLKVIQRQIKNSLSSDLDELSKCDLSDINCYGWHEIEFKDTITAPDPDTKQPTINYPEIPDSSK